MSVSVAVIRDTVPVRFGRVIVLSAVAFVGTRNVSWSSAEEPSKIIPLVAESKETPELRELPPNIP